MSHYSRMRFPIRYSVSAIPYQQVLFGSNLIGEIPMSTIQSSLPFYLPNPKVCHMAQYQCCKHRLHCRLYSRCAAISLQTVCKRDCPSCTYSGCTMSMERRRETPVYIAGVIQGERLDLDLEGRWLREHTEHLPGKAGGQGPDRSAKPTVPATEPGAACGLQGRMVSGEQGQDQCQAA